MGILRASYQHPTCGCSGGLRGELALVLIRTDAQTSGGVAREGADTLPDGSWAVCLTFCDGYQDMVRCNLVFYYG